MDKMKCRRREMDKIKCRRGDEMDKVNCKREDEIWIKLNAEEKARDG